MMLESNCIKEGFVVRKATIKDLDRIIYINRVSLPENYTRYFFVEHLNKWPNAFFVAEVNGEVVGYVMSRVELGWGHTKLGLVKKGHIVSLAVLEGYRRRGIGTALMRASIEGLRNYGAKEVYLEVRVSNTPAIKLYEKLGFVKKKIIPSYYLDGEDAYLMVKSLK